MPKVSKKLIEFKKILEEDEIGIYKNGVIEKLNLDFLINYVNLQVCFLNYQNKTTFKLK